MEAYRAKPEKTPAPVIRYRKKRMVKDVEAESLAGASAMVNSMPEQPGDPFNRVWGVCEASDHLGIAHIEGMFQAKEQPLFSEEELKKCAR